ncbi:MAG: hypothetical protein ACOYJG_01375 [Prevotella sp.]|jgi:hypothetical protein
MRKFIIIMIALFTYGNMCRAADADHLIVWLTDGTSTSYALDEKPVITYNDDHLVLTAPQVEVDVPLDDVLKLTFGDEADAIQQVETTDQQESIKANSDGVELSGFKAGTKVGLYGVNGTTLGQYTIPESGTLHISLAAMGSGLYIVKAGRSSIKIVRK